MACLVVFCAISCSVLKVRIYDLGEATREPSLLRKTSILILILEIIFELGLVNVIYGYLNHNFNMFFSILWYLTFWCHLLFYKCSQGSERWSTANRRHFSGLNLYWTAFLLTIVPHRTNQDRKSLIFSEQRHGLHTADAHMTRFSCYSSFFLFWLSKIFPYAYPVWIKSYGNYF